MRSPHFRTFAMQHHPSLSAISYQPSTISHSSLRPDLVRQRTGLAELTAQSWRATARPPPGLSNLSAQLSGPGVRSKVHARRPRLDCVFLYVQFAHASRRPEVGCRQDRDGCVGARRVSGLTSAAKAMLSAVAASRTTTVLVVPTDAEVERMTADARFFLAALEGLSGADVERSVLPFPSHEVDPTEG